MPALELIRPFVRPIRAFPGAAGSQAARACGVRQKIWSRAAGFWDTAHFHVPPPRVSWSTGADAGPFGPPGALPGGPPYALAYVFFGGGGGGVSMCDYVREQ
jgi:hypothetical protein